MVNVTNLIADRTSFKMVEQRAHYTHTINPDKAQALNAGGHRTFNNEWMKKRNLDSQDKEMGMHVDDMLTLEANNSMTSFQFG